MKVFLAVFLFALNVSAADGNFLSAVKSEEKSGKIYLHFQLSQPASLANIEGHFLRRTIEWDLANVKLKKDKIFHTVAMSGISNVYISQNGEESTRIRVNLDEGQQASAFADRLSFTQEGQVLSLVMNTAVGLNAANSKEMTRSYSVGDGIEWSVNNTLKVSSKETKPAAATVTAAAAPENVATPVEASATMDETSSLMIDDTKNENEIPLNAPKASEKSAGSSAGRMAVGLAVIMLLGLSVFFVGKKINSKRLSAPFNHDSIKVVSQKYLGPKRNLTLVRVAGEYMLLGVTDHNISLIKTLSVVDDEIPELTPGDFGTAIKNLTQKETKAPVDVQAEEVEDAFTISSLNDVKNVMRKRKYIDEADF